MHAEINHTDWLAKTEVVLTLQPPTPDAVYTVFWIQHSDDEKIVSFSIFAERFLRLEGDIDLLLSIIIN